MAMHIPEFIYMHQNLAQFTQGLEKLNDQTTIDFARRTDHNHRNLDAHKKLLQKETKWNTWKKMDLINEHVIIVLF